MSLLSGIYFAIFNISDTVMVTYISATILRERVKIILKVSCVGLKVCMFLIHITKWASRKIVQSLFLTGAFESSHFPSYKAFASCFSLELNFKVESLK